MTDTLLTRYNYDSFVPENFGPCMRFDESPELGALGPSFPLWHLGSDGLGGSETTLHDILSQNIYTVVEFGSFT